MAVRGGSCALVAPITPPCVLIADHSELKYTMLYLSLRERTWTCCNITSLMTAWMIFYEHIPSPIDRNTVHVLAF